MDLALGVDKDTAEEKDEASGGKEERCYELEVCFHGVKYSQYKSIFFFLWRSHKYDLHKRYFLKSGANIYQKRGGLQIFRHFF